MTVQNFIESCMRLEDSALQALHIIPQSGSDSLAGGVDKGKTSLYGFLNQCKTSGGSKLLCQWLTHPLVDRKNIEFRLVLVEMFVADTTLRLEIRDNLMKGLTDLVRLSDKISNGKAQLEDFVNCYDALLKSMQIFEALDACQYDSYGSLSSESLTALKDTYLSTLKDNIQQLEPFKVKVEKSIDMSAALNHQYMVRSDNDEGLMIIRQDMESCLSAIEQEAAAVAGDLGVELEKKLKLEQNTLHGHHLRVTRTDGRLIQGNSEYIELSIQKSGIMFTTQRLRKLSKQYKNLQESYQTAQSSLVKNFISECSDFANPLRSIGEVVAHLDVILTFAHIAVNSSSSYVKPKFYNSDDDGEGVNLVGSRHPLVELNGNFISNDVDLIKNVSNFAIITGPNTGGKSTYIRQIGMIAIMAQIGCFVPCTSARLPIFDSIMCRIGAGDQQLKGVSTFMAEMLDTSAILQQATDKSLVIIDELGRGTSTYDGFGLAWSISEHLASEIKCYTLFATHFHELTTLSHQLSNVVNLHVSAVVNENAIDGDADALTLLYKVEKGVCDESFGLHVAKSVRFPSEVVRMAEEKVYELENGYEESYEQYYQKQVQKYGAQQLEEGDKLLKSTLEASQRNDENSVLTLLSELDAKKQSNQYLLDVLQE
ncbi:hypothetical protein MIR68_004328 [Amoeboaphelidium protococcarum]|nr:hypothetical protein MIR68_004328 [Amoeboaphelidium protococcarum]